MTEEQEFAAFYKAYPRKVAKGDAMLGFNENKKFVMDFNESINIHWANVAKLYSGKNVETASYQRFIPVMRVMHRHL